MLGKCVSVCVVGSLKHSLFIIDFQRIRTKHAKSREKHSEIRRKSKSKHSKYEGIRSKYECKPQGTKHNRLSKRLKALNNVSKLYKAIFEAHRLLYHSVYSKAPIAAILVER